ncbi:crotonase/enoyl-CoA hydratase family protein [Stutzerimonas kirkiae]|uniref:Crotonase/enoyl-CoA hydratase family protein n=1 Tax=Stutzerimonas kirkiae TaxID=2211392 RepID=A0A4Q9R6N2_9GAMM|nr:crotonase/enoyl-CoA hydratase family protein [Stutzerimonas kirkiae]TBU96240.1 crotonase/enoyl-CoA hydratase family protein [Stutzerimonas kirkiae]TBV03417.1 crotonase/enoyl-CoA hydratase family protein [Stutzerimonas kirkiae]TBV12938.1 crotonase/enoyl-CoA hydratase family protein [Stutzerimonas kirkiae]
MSELVAYRLEDGVATLTLNNGRVNALSPAVFDELNAALDRAEQDRAVVVLRGQPGVLSGGYDLKVMNAGPQQAVALVTRGSSFSRRLLAHPYPVVVACSGHAIAKGAFLLLSGDYRIGVDGAFRIGLNEVQIGMTMHQAGIELARDRLRGSAFQRAVINAELFEPRTALEAGFFDRLVPVGDFEDAVREAAAQLKGLNMLAHRNTKLKVRQALLEALDQAIELDQRHLG